MRKIPTKNFERCTPEQAHRFLTALFKQCDERGLQLHTVHVSRNNASGAITDVRLSYTET